MTLDYIYMDIFFVSFMCRCVMIFMYDFVFMCCDNCMMLMYKMMFNVINANLILG
jgi:hypothetical protein